MMDNVYPCSIRTCFNVSSTSVSSIAEVFIRRLHLKDDRRTLGTPVQLVQTVFVKIGKHRGHSHAGHFIHQQGAVVSIRLTEARLPTSTFSIFRHSGISSAITRYWTGCMQGCRALPREKKHFSSRMRTGTSTNALASRIFGLIRSFSDVMAKGVNYN